MDNNNQNQKPLKFGLEGFWIQPKIHFSLKYFEFPTKDIQPKELKKAIGLLSRCNNKTWKELQINKYVILEKSLKTKEIALSLIKCDEKFLKSEFGDCIWDLKRGKCALRVFGVFNEKKYFLFIKNWP